MAVAKMTFKMRCVYFLIFEIPAQRCHNRIDAAMFQGLTNIGKDLLSKNQEVTLFCQQITDVAVLQYCLEVGNMLRFPWVTAVAVSHGHIGVFGKLNIQSILLILFRFCIPYKERV